MHSLKETILSGGSWSPAMWFIFEYIATFLPNVAFILLQRVWP